MVLCWASISICYSDIQAARCMGSTETRVSQDWDCPLPSDIALKLPMNKEPTILLSDQREALASGYERSNTHTVIFCSNLVRAREWLRDRGAEPGPTRSGAGPDYFEVCDPEGNIIEICQDA